MWPFRKRTSIAGSGVLKGMTDWHCHLLPGVDDGARTMEETMQILSAYERMGIGEAWLTPHIMEDMPNTTAALRERFRELQDAYHGPLTLRLASENMLDNLFEERLRDGDLLPLGRDGSHLLVETSYFSPPMGLDDIMRRIRARGYVPVLAHPERYAYMDQEDYHRLKGLDVRFQLNLPSLTGAYGPEARRKAEWLLKHNLYDLTGTDTHRLSSWEAIVNRKQIAKDVLQIRCLW